MKRILFLLATMPLLLGSCNKDDNGTDPDAGGTTNGGDIVFAIGIGSQMQTKVATGADFKSAFEDGDEIGIFAVSHASGTPKALAASGNYIHNVKLTYADASHTWASDNGLWFPAGSNELDFYAYYPYDVAATNPTNITFNVMTAQSSATMFSASDLLIATPQINVAKSTTPVALTFAHKLALVQVEVEPTYIDPNANFSVTLNNFKTGGTFDLRTSSVTTADTKQYIRMFRVEQQEDAAYTTKYTYRALVPAQEVAQGASLCLMAQNGQPYITPPLAEALALTAGDAQRYTAKLPVTATPTTKISAGTFQMGEEDWATPVHQVTLTKDFYMSKYQITNAQYAAFLNAKGIGENGEGSVTYYKDNFTTPVTENQTFLSNNSWGVKWDTDKWIPATGKDNFPVIYVTWYGAKAYADWVGGSLPTEAQWEYACRAGTTTAYSFGANTIGNFAWYANNSSNTTHEVGKKLPNHWDLYDMHGNVWEWCSDWYSAYTADTATDPKGADTGSSRVLRGGSWIFSAQNCGSAYRSDYNPGSAISYIGLRVVFVP